MKNIFFSYCWADEQKVLPFVENLIKKINYDINDYYLDRKINKVGDQYWKNINNAIATCQLFIFFNSNNYYNSSACCKEYVWALQRQKEENIKIIEIKLEDTDLYRPYLDQVYVKFEDDQILDKLYDAIYNNDFSGFEVTKIFNNVEVVREKEIAKINFKFTKNVLKPILIFLVEKHKNDDIEIKQLLNIETSELVTHDLERDYDLSDVELYLNLDNKKISIDNKFNYIIKIELTQPKYSGEQININYKFSKRNNIMLVHNPNLGDQDKLISYEPIFWHIS